jgi:lysophospholipase L1-like esterase
MSIRQNVLAAAVAAAILAAWAGVSRGEVPVKDGEKIAFLGDSITQGGMGQTGYVTLVISGLKANGVKATAVGAGISGHKSNDMLARLERDVLSKKPEWMTLSCGVNDVWHGARGVPLDQYKKNITEIIDKAQAAGIKVVILTATMIREDAGNPENGKLAAYNDFLRELAKEKKCLLADLNAEMHKALDEGEKAGKKRGTMLTTDGVHMNGAGNMMMAVGVLKGFGLDDAQIAKAKEAWGDLPASVTVKANLTVRQLEALEKAAEAQGKSVEAILQSAVDKQVAELLGGGGATGGK